MKRNNILYKLLPLTIMAGMILGGCGQTSTSEQTNSFTEEKKSHTSYKADDFRDKEASKLTTTYEIITENTGNDKNPLIYSSLTLPTVTIEDNEEVASIINDTMSLYKDVYHQNLNNYKDAANKKRMDHPDTFESYSYYSDFYLERADENMICFTHSEYVFEDDKHTSELTTTVNFDAKTGVLLTLSDISDDLQSMLTVMKQQIITQAGSSYYANNFKNDPSSTEFATAVDGLLTDDYWFLNDCGLNIIANQYSLGSLYQGNITFMIPYAYLDGLIKKDYVPNSAFVFPVAYDSVAMNYLNDDEELDTICLTSSIADENGSRTPFIAINGKDYTDVLEKAEITYFESLMPYYYLIDLDANDKFVEFAICDWGANDYLQTYFFRYTGKDVIYLGNITDMPDRTAVFYGDGTLKCQTRLNLMETKSANVTYALKDNKLSFVEPEWYYPINDMYEDTFLRHDVLKQITVYTDKDTTSETYTLLRGDGPIKILAVDDKEWGVIETLEHNIYFVHMSSPMEIDSDGETISIMDAFSNLLIAG